MMLVLQILKSLICGEDGLDFDLTSADVLFFRIFTLTPSTPNCGESEFLFSFMFSFFLSEVPAVGTVCEFSFSLPKFS